MSARRIVELTETRALSSSVRSLAWRCTDGAPLEYVAGQWLNFHVPLGDTELRRAYSIACAPGATRPDCFDIAVTQVRGGHASRVLHGLAPGARVAIDGPHGFFTREGARGEAALFVATGTGVCPLRAMIEDELRAAHGPKLVLLFGCRREEDILYRDDFERWAAASARFTCRVTLSRPGPGWTGARGHVQDHLVELAREPGVHAYVCGLQKMIKDVRRVLREDLGWDRKRIHSERYD
jgi:ferredoxin-NADP reductase